MMQFPESKVANFAQGTSPLERAAVIWLTGLSGAGKTTIGQELTARLKDAGNRVEFLDGDIVRQTICQDLGFSYDDRCENIRRIGLAAERLMAQGIFVVVAAISPYQRAREAVRQRIKRFVEVHVDAPLSVCEQRDVKGLYRRARAGEIKQFTGISDPFEPPLFPEVVCRTDQETVSGSVAKIIDYLTHH